VVTSREWVFAGGSPATSTDLNPQITYATAGDYPVKLVVHNAQGADSIVKQNMIHVFPSTSLLSGDIYEDFEMGMNNWSVVNQNGNGFEITDSASYHGSHSVRLVNFQDNASGSIDELVSPAYDLSSISGLIKVKFARAYVAKEVAANAIAELLYGTSTADTIYDKLTFSVSSDCGKTWSVKKTYSGASLATSGCKTTSFLADSTKFWKEDSVIITSVSDKSNLRFKFTFTGQGGNNLYLDRICTGTCGIVGMEENIGKTIDLSIYPNPMHESSTIQFNLAQTSKVKIVITDVLGREIYHVVDKELPQGANVFTVKRSPQMVNGLYLVKIMVDNQWVTKKIVID
jgi:PKD repeat protein